MLDTDHHCVQYAKMAIVSNFLQEATKTEVIETKDDTLSNSGNENNCTQCASKTPRNSSVFQLIIDPKDDRLIKYGSMDGLKKALYIISILLLIAVLCLMTGLYITQQKKFSNSRSHSRETQEQTKATAATTTKKKTILRTLSECVPVLNAYPLPEMPPELANLTKKLGKYVEQYYMKSKIKAASVGISYRGKIWWSKHIGSMNFSDSNAASPNDDTPYPVASITKLFTTLMMYKLFEEGKLRSFDDPVNKYVPEFSIKNPFNSEKITFRQLSSMLSGLPREAPCYPPEKFNFCPFNNSEMWQRVSNMSLIIRPDKNPSYSNLGYSVLGRALEKIAGVKYEDWMAKNIFKPLKMNNSGLDLLRSTKRFPVSTNADGTIARIVDWGWQQPAGGLYSSINDLNQAVKLLFNLINGTSVLNKNSARQLFKPAFLYNTGHGTGYSFEIINSRVYAATSHHSKSFLEHLIYAKNGACPGYGSWIALVPEFKFAAFSLTAHGGDERASGNLLLPQLQAMEPLEKVLLRSIPKYKLPPSPYSYVGKYKIKAYWPLVTELAEVHLTGGTLYLKIHWFTAALSYVSPWVLVTGHFGKAPIKNCEDNFLQSGLSHMKCFFKKPLQPGGKSLGFHVNGITTYGYADFERVL